MLTQIIWHDKMSLKYISNVSNSLRGKTSIQKKKISCKLLYFPNCCMFIFNSFLILFSLPVSVVWNDYTAPHYYKYCLSHHF